MLAWLKMYAWWLAIISAALGIAAVAVGLAILMTLPEDHFLRNEEASPSTKPRRAIHIALLVLKNIVGGCIVVLGAIMALPLVPGPGVIMLIIGLSLMSFPGKRKLELRILRAPLALGAINWLRSKGGRPALRLPEKKGSEAI
jgi:hypothetical protein